MKGTCLFVVNGLGLGNSTRCHAVIEQLTERGVEVHVLTSGNGLGYFGVCAEVASVTPTQAFFYASSHGHISGLKTLASLGRLYPLARAKREDLDRLLQRLAVDAVVTDSEYGSGPARRRGIPVLGLNNADVVVTEYLRRAGKPRSIAGQFWLMEFMDYLFHRYRCDWVISPAPTPGAVRHPRIRRVGLIIRRRLRRLTPSCRGPFPPPVQLRRVLFMLSGSTFASEVDFGRGELPFRVDVVGRSGDNVGSVVFHGRLLDNTSFLEQADALVINAGASAVSEAIALNKPTFVIPLPHHAEQYVNARVLAELGCGYVAEAGSVLGHLLRVHATNRWVGLARPAPAINLDGAQEAAEVICAVIAQRRQRECGAP